MGLTAGVGLALVYLGIFGIVWGITRLLRVRRWQRDARANLTRSLFPSSVGRPGDGRAIPGTVLNLGTPATVNDPDAGTGINAGNYFRRYRDAVNGPARPRTIHRDHFGAGVVLGAAVGDPHSSDAPSVVGQP